MPAWRTAALAVAIIAATALALYLMGSTPICSCGFVRLWHGGVVDAENSQHLTDWYSLSHVVHGFVFYGLLRLLAKATGRAWPVGALLLAAVAIEGAWEILENSPIIVERYRAQTMALGYTGDSIVNSVADIVLMIVGFGLAARLPVAASVAVALALEIVALVIIRDNLTLNLLMLIWPLDAVLDWQQSTRAAFVPLLPLLVPAARTVRRRLRPPPRRSAVWRPRSPIPPAR